MVGHPPWVLYDGVGDSPVRSLGCPQWRYTTPPFSEWSRNEFQGGLLP